MIFSSTDILSTKQLKRLSEHKYSSYGSTLLDPVMQRFWSYFVTKIPLWFAPNLLTVLGLLVNATTTIILIYYSPDARQEVPSWSLILFAIGLFIYQTLDACDGKQARRTSSSSPLGELFDHGCDSLSTVFVAIATCISVQIGHHPGWMFYQCIAASVVFYTAHWQTYVSATLRFGKFDVTEAQFTVIFINIISAIFGTKIWSTKIPIVNIETYLVLSYTILLGGLISFYYYIVIIFTGGVGKNGSTVAIIALNCEMKIIPVAVAALIHIIMTFKNFSVILSGGVGKNGSTVAGTSVLSPFIPLAIVVLPAFIIYQKSTSHVFETHLCIYLLTFGFILAKITNKLIVAHMTKSEMEYLDSVLFAPAMLFLNQYFNTFLNEYFVLCLALVYTVVDLYHYATIVCFQISSYLNINIFTIKQQPMDNEKALHHLQQQQQHQRLTASVSLNSSSSSTSSMNLNKNDRLNSRNTVNGDDNFESIALLSCLPDDNDDKEDEKNDEKNNFLNEIEMINVKSNDNQDNFIVDID